MSTPKIKASPSSLQLVCDKEVVIRLERLSDSVVMEMTMHRSVPLPEQVQ